MAKKCEICGKGPQYGHNVSHSKVRTNRRFLPNLQTLVRFEVEGSVGVPVIEVNVNVQGVYEP